MEGQNGTGQMRQDTMGQKGPAAIPWTAPQRHFSLQQWDGVTLAAMTSVWGTVRGAR